MQQLSVSILYEAMFRYDEVIKLPQAAGLLHSTKRAAWREFFTIGQRMGIVNFKGTEGYAIESS